MMFSVYSINRFINFTLIVVFDYRILMENSMFPLSKRNGSIFIQFERRNSLERPLDGNVPQYDQGILFEVNMIEQF